MASVVKWASTWRRPLAPISVRAEEASASASARLVASASTFPGATSQPVVLRPVRMRLCQHRLGRRADVGGNDRASQGRRLDRGPAEGLGLGGGDHRDVRGKVGRRDVGHVPDHAHVAGEAEAANLSLELGNIGIAPLRVAGQHDDGIPQRPQLLQAGGSVEQHALALPARQPGGLQDDARVRRHAPIAAQRGDTLRRDRSGIEDGGIHTAVDHRDALRDGVVAREDQIALCNASWR